MNGLPNNTHGRPTSDKKLQWHMMDEENTMLYSPVDYTGNKFFGSWNKLVLLPQMLDHESRTKVINKWSAKLKAELELETIPECFGKCVGPDMSEAMNSQEKNCMRECYFKKVSSRDDFHMFAEQRFALETAKNMRESHV